MTPTQDHWKSFVTVHTRLETYQKFHSLQNTIFFLITLVNSHKVFCIGVIHSAGTKVKISHRPFICFLSFAKSWSWLYEQFRKFSPLLRALLFSFIKPTGANALKQATVSYFFLFLTGINHLFDDMPSHLNTLPIRKLSSYYYVLYFHI